VNKGGAAARAGGVLLLLAALLVPLLTRELLAPANYGGHALTSGFGRGRLDLSGVVSEGAGQLDLPAEPMVVTLRLSGNGPIRLKAAGVEQTIVGTEVPTAVRVDLAGGGRVEITSNARLRLHDFILERARVPRGPLILLAILGLLGAVAASRSPGLAGAASVLMVAVFAVSTNGTLSWTFARILGARLLPVFLVILLLLPLALVLRKARFPGPVRPSRTVTLAFVATLAVTALQFRIFDQPLPLGDPGAYLEMGSHFASAFAAMNSPLDLGPALSQVQAELALPATGLLYGLLQLLGGLWAIYSAQALAMAAAVAAMVAICEEEIGPRAARLALVLALLHPSFSILPGIVQPEPFILAAWTKAALIALRSRGEGTESGGYVSAGLLLGLGLALHPQGLSFLLLAIGLCLLPWAAAWSRRPALLIALLSGAASVLLPVAAAERFSEPRNYVLDQEYGFFAFTSPHPLGFWMYVDSHGWQGPLRLDDTSYQKELNARQGGPVVSSSYGDVAGFVARHPARSLRTVLTNLHRLWQQPDNPFAVPYVLPYETQILFHRALFVLFVLSLPALLSGRLALLALPFVILSMTYPAYHVFNKYATPALTFTLIGAAYTMDRWARETGSRRRWAAGLTAAAVGALLPASLLARAGVPGEAFMIVARGLLWIGLGAALAASVKGWGEGTRAKGLGGAIGLLVLLVSSWVASLEDTARSAWSVALDEPFEVSCRFAPAAPDPALGPAWLLIDAQSASGVPPRLTVNGQLLPPPVPMMPTFGLASIRGHREPSTFRQMWRSPLGEDLLAEGRLAIEVRGHEGTWLFGDIREGAGGPRLSLGNWPHLSVYRLMHEGQYRLPVAEAPAQACSAEELSGRPGVSLARIPAGQEDRIDRQPAVALQWVF